MQFTGKAVANLAVESGTHRVSRIPDNEKRGRRHTSAVTVSVLPVPERIADVFDEKDVRVDTFRSTGPGGQNRNKSETAVRAIHIPTGLTAVVADEKSQLTNRGRALSLLAARVQSAAQRRVERSRDRARAKHHGTGNIAGRFRSYLWREGIVVNHENGASARLKSVLDGDISALW